MSSSPIVDSFAGKVSYYPGLLIGFHILRTTLPRLTEGGPGVEENNPDPAESASALISRQLDQKRLRYRDLVA